MPGPKWIPLSWMEGPLNEYNQLGELVARVDFVLEAGDEELTCSVTRDTKFFKEKYATRIARVKVFHVVGMINSEIDD